MDSYSFFYFAVWKILIIPFYYLIKLCDDFKIPDNGEPVSQKDNCNVITGWMPLDQLQNITIYPEFLKKEIYI